MRTITEKEEAKIKLMVETGDIPRLLAMGFYSVSYTNKSCHLQGNQGELGFIAGKQMDKMRCRSHIYSEQYILGIDIVSVNDDEDKKDGQNDD